MESRYFDEKWKNTKHYPVETRDLFVEESSQPTGKIRLWTEILMEQAEKKKHINLLGEESRLSGLTSSISHSKSIDTVEESKRRDWDISMMPPGGFELRVIIWDIQNCPIDDPEGLTDIYVTCSMPSYDSKLIMLTDTHIRSEGFVDSLSYRDHLTGE